MTLPLFPQGPLTDAPATELRPYQERAVRLAAMHIEQGKKRILLTLPTASGKMFILASIIRRATVPVLFVCHRMELIDQCVRELERQRITNVGVIRGDDERFNPSASIQIASIQTLTRRDKPRAGLVICDEAHRCMSDTWLALLQHYKDAIILGFTASPCRSDGRPLGELFEVLETVASYSELLKRPEWLAEPDCYSTPVRADLSGVSTKHGDYDEPALAEVMSQERLVGNLLDHWLELAHRYPVFLRGQRVPGETTAGERRRTFIFAVDIRHSKAICDRFSAAGVRIAHLDGTTPEDERRAILQALRNGELQCISNCNVLLEGVDAPEVKCVVHARPTQSLVLWLQCLDAQTEILTNRGFLGPNKIQQDDLVAAMNIHDSSVTWQPITRIVDREIRHDECMYSISSAQVDIRVTNMHRMLYQPKMKILERTFWTKSWSIELAENLQKINQEYKIPVAGFEEADGVELTDDEIRFVGWFLTDGTLDKATNSIRIVQAEGQPHLVEIDKCLIGCGFKYGRYRSTHKNKFANAQPQICFQISHGRPRGKDTHLKGWGESKVKHFIDKNLSLEFERINRRQLGVLLEAIHLGDGSKQNSKEWTRRSYHITSANKTFVDRLQSLCVRRGWRCNVSTYRSTYSGKKIYVLHIKDSHKRSIGYEKSGRTMIRPAPSVPGERIWCVDNPLGTIFIRRGGKVAVVGNSVGRILRPWKAPRSTLDGSNDPTPTWVRPLILDHAGNWDRHGPPHEDRIWSLSNVVGRKSSSKPYKLCRACFAYVQLSNHLCPYCKYIFTAQEMRPPPKETADSLALRNGQNVRRSDAPENVRREFFDRMSTIARVRGFKPGYAAAKHKEHYGEWPPNAWSDVLKDEFATDAQWQGRLERRLREKAEEEGAWDATTDDHSMSVGVDPAGMGPASVADPTFDPADAVDFDVYEDGSETFSAWVRREVLQ